jgi:hypothetical protein
VISQRAIKRQDEPSRESSLKPRIDTQAQICKQESQQSPEKSRQAQSRRGQAQDVILVLVLLAWSLATADPDL